MQRMDRRVLSKAAIPLLHSFIREFELDWQFADLPEEPQVILVCGARGQSARGAIENEWSNGLWIGSPELTRLPRRRLPHIENSLLGRWFPACDVRTQQCHEDQQRPHRDSW